MRAALRLLAMIAGALASVPAPAQQPDGRALFVRADKGNCVACHRLPEGAGPATKADIGPPLDGARLKGWDAARLRALLDDPTRMNPDTVKPPYGRHRILEDAEIERLVEFLRALP
jgi:sulfur-oxidizing protein SoxX